MSELVIKNGEFYHMQLNDREGLFETQSEAIEFLKKHSEELDLSNPDVQLAHVETGEEWAIEGVPWQNIAVQLL